VPAISSLPRHNSSCAGSFNFLSSLLSLFVTVLNGFSFLVIFLFYFNRAVD